MNVQSMTGLICAAVLLAGMSISMTIVGLESVSAKDKKAGVEKGSQLFQETGCSGCHYTASREEKVCPGLKGLFDRKTLPVSGRLVMEANVRDQIIDPYGRMPSFEDNLKARQIEAIVAYLKTL